MEFVGSIITGLRTIIGAIYPPLKKKYFDQPKLYLQFKYESGLKSPRGLSPMNDTSQPIDIMSAIYHNDLQWRYTLIIRNNSEHTAYNIQLLKPQQDNSFKLNPSIELLKPIQPNHEEKYKVHFSIFHVGTGKEASDLVEKHPDLLTQRNYILQYTNVKGTKFFTVFDGIKEEQYRNEFFKKLKKE